MIPLVIAAMAVVAYVVYRLIHQRAIQRLFVSRNRTVRRMSCCVRAVPVKEHYDYASYFFDDFSSVISMFAIFV